MKRILRILVICLIIVPSVCLAAGRNVTFDVNFIDVDSSLIDNIYVNYTDKSENEYSITLKKNNNFYYSYDLYSGSDILRVSVSFDQNNLFADSSIVKSDNGYNIHINVKSQSDNEIIIDNTPPTSEVIPSTTTVSSNQTTIVQSKTTFPVENKTGNTEKTEDKQTKMIKNVYIFILIVGGIFVFIFSIYAFIKIVNANK